MPSIMRKMNIIARCQSQYRSNALASDLNACHHSFVLAICRHPGLSQDQIAAHLCLNKSTVARALVQLEESGYVRRVASEKDKRLLLVYPTERMQEIHPRVLEITKEWNRKLSEDVSEEDMERFLWVLASMEKKAKELIGNGGADA